MSSLDRLIALCEKIVSTQNEKSKIVIVKFKHAIGSLPRIRNDVLSEFRNLTDNNQLIRESDPSAFDSEVVIAPKSIKNGGKLILSDVYKFAGLSDETNDTHYADDFMYSLYTLLTEICADEHKENMRNTAAQYNFGTSDNSIAPTDRIDATNTTTTTNTTTNEPINMDALGDMSRIQGMLGGMNTQDYGDKLKKLMKAQPIQNMVSAMQQSSEKGNPSVEDIFAIIMQNAGSLIKDKELINDCLNMDPRLRNVYETLTNDMEPQEMHEDSDDGEEIPFHSK